MNAPTPKNIIEQRHGARREKYIDFFAKNSILLLNKKSPP